ncbi:MAG: ADP-ribosylglycohydrolase family protein, partial [Deltaproteobacteria bacterium]|nr:ADP-ribosylglycohydrolase family protein [Candidatus Tharpella aukensis]
TVPQAITASLESENYEDAIRNAISLGGDSDTMACITGGIAEAFYGKLPKDITETAMNILDKNLREIVVRFYGKYIHFEI